MPDAPMSPAPDPHDDPPGAEGGTTKKEQILSLFAAGIREVEDIAMLTGVRPSYVASVLQ
ncbi:MAG: hypothetical protein KatS3mg042_0952 [Rhodothermaceae bacterium]|nr:MAG: hypothetical protein KatS3mg042_0952 [Rhodothermaceae bacterium]